MKAVMYGAGNIGRGFIGALFAKSGYHVTFIDVSMPVVEALNARGGYPVRVLAGRSTRDEWISPVKAVDGRDEAAVAQAIADADIMATAVGVKILPRIAGAVARGLALRFSRTDAPLNIIICENLIDADKAFRKMLLDALPPSDHQALQSRVGLVEASIGRMVPVQTPEMQDGDSLRVCVEEYGFLPVDKNAFIGRPPAIAGMEPRAPFDFFIRRKLFLHNMGHAACAYLGLYAGREYVWQSIEDADTRLICLSAMVESAVALAKAYGEDIGGLAAHAFDLIARFGNRALGDTCARVGADTARKLAPADRLIGAARLCLQQGVTPAAIALGAAAGLHRHLKESDGALSPQAALQALSGLSAQDPLATMILRLHGRMAEGATISQLRQAADELRAELGGEIL